MSNSPTKLNLVVLRSPDIERASTFYLALGLKLKMHHHGDGPEHYSALVDGMVFEIYPLGNRPPTTGVRIGFEVEEIETVVARLVEYGAEVMSPTVDSEWGLRAVLKDLDGHIVELLDRSRGD